MTERLQDPPQPLLYSNDTLSLWVAHCLPNGPLFCVRSAAQAMVEHYVTLANDAPRFVRQGRGYSAWRDSHPAVWQVIQSDSEASSLASKNPGAAYHDRRMLPPPAGLIHK